jgi:hypothetical protein
MKPTLGRIVHYKNSIDSIVPGIITAIDVDNNVSITLFLPNQEEYIKKSSMAAGPTQAEAGQWWWPERL